MTTDDCILTDDEITRHRESAKLKYKTRWYPHEALDLLECGFPATGWYLCDPNAQIVQFPIRRHEMMTLAYFFLLRVFSLEAFMAQGGCCGGSDCDDGILAWKRFEEIQEILSPGVPIPEFQELIEDCWEQVDEIRAARYRMEEQEEEINFCMQIHDTAKWEDGSYVAISPQDFEQRHDDTSILEP